MMHVPSRGLAASVSLLALLSHPALADPAPTLPILVVTAQRMAVDLARIGSAVTVIGSDEIERSGSKGLVDVLETVPGLYIHEQGGIGTAATATLRGASPGQTLVLLDGIRIGDTTGTDTTLDFGSIAATDIERIEVLRGPQTALYGSSAMGGVINIITRKGKGEPKRTVMIEGGSYGLIHGRASLSGGTETMSYALSIDALHTDGFPRYGYRIDRLKGQLPPAPKGDPTDRGGVTGRFSWLVGDGIEVETGFAGFGNLITFDNPYAFLPENVFSRFNRQRQWTAQAYVKASATAFDGKLKNALTLFGNLTDRTVAQTESCPPFYAANCYTMYRGNRTGAEYQGDLKLGSYGTLIFGARTETDRAKTSYEESPRGSVPEVPLFNRSQTTNSVFALHSFTLGSQLDLSLGGRVDAVQGGASFPTWRATAAWRIPDSGTKLRASAGTGAKIPSLYQRYSDYGTPDLRPEKSVGVDAGIDQTLFGGMVTASATVFLNRYRDLIDFSYGCDAAHPFGCYYNVGRAETRGIEASADAVLVPDEWRLRTSYTFLQSQNLLTDSELLQRPRHKGTVSLIYTGMPKLEVEGRVTFVGARLDFLNVRLAPYAKLDAYATYRLTETVSLFARAENLTDARYEEVYNYGVAGRSLYGGMKVSW
jgi:vitamin B12 transporter